MTNIPAFKPVTSSLREMSIPDNMVNKTPTNAYLDKCSLKNSTPNRAVATSSKFNQMETDVEFALFKPANKNRGPNIPPNVIIPSNFRPLFFSKAGRKSALKFLTIYGRNTSAAPKYNNPANI